MEVQTTFEIDGHIIEASFTYNQYYDDASGESLLHSEIDHDQTNIISVSDTENEDIYTDDFTDNHWNMLDKWVGCNDPVDDGIG